MKVRNHKDLELYKAAVKFVTSIYPLTKSFPEDERFGLISQIRRAAVSIPSNITYGACCQKEYKRIYSVFIPFLGICCRNRNPNRNR